MIHNTGYIIYNEEFIWLFICLEFGWTLAIFGIATVGMDWIMRISAPKDLFRSISDVRRKYIDSAI